MGELVNIILTSGRIAVELLLYVLLPVMVVMSAMMKLLEAKRVLAWTARVLSPVLLLFGIPGIGAFAILQLLFVGFAAPAATLLIMEKSQVPKRGIAATLAAVLAMPQANAVFPLVAVGLDYRMILLTSFAGGIVAALVASRLVRNVDTTEQTSNASALASMKGSPGVLQPLLQGGREGLELVIKSVPILILAIFLIKSLEAIGAVSLLESGLTPVFELVGLPSIVVLPLATKFLAGGTAMTGLTINLVQEGSLSATDLNRVAGFLINPLDLVGLAVLASVGSRVASVARPAIIGAAVGVLVRGVLHLVLF